MADDLSIVQQRPASMARMFLDRVAATPQAESFRYPVSGGWQSTTWQQTGDRVRALAAGLIALGVAAEERVAIISTTRVDWVLADFAIMCAGAATTTVYPTTPADDVAFILADSGSRFAFAENDTQIEKLREHREKLPELEQVVTFDGTADDDWVISFDELERRGREHLSTLPNVVDTAVDAIGPENLATLIYTSGTTGRPKGVRLVHDSWAYEGKAIEALDLLTAERRAVPVAAAVALVRQGAAVRPARHRLRERRRRRHHQDRRAPRRRSPDVHGCRAAHLREGPASRDVDGEEEGGAKAKIFHWAFGVGREVSALQRAGKSVRPVLKVQHAIADKLVFSKLRGRFGGQLRYFVSGSAALSDKVAEFFHAAGILILEGYGLTETSAAPSSTGRTTTSSARSAGRCRAPRCVSPTTARSCVRGPGVMRGYHNLPRETEETLTDDGWLRTGDIGELDDQGFLRITDRKKDLIKTSGGKYVAPQAIEVMFKALCPYASQIVVHGDGRNYVTALITLDPEAIEKWAEQTRRCRRGIRGAVQARRRPRDAAGLRRRGQRPLHAGRPSRSSPSCRGPHRRGGRADAEPEGQAQGRREEVRRRARRVLRGACTGKALTDAEVRGTLESVPSRCPPGKPVPADGALPDSARAAVGQQPFSLYVHVPFCATRCGYCDFNTYTADELGRGSRERRTPDSAISEMRLARRVLGDVDLPVHTVFVGGGTPTLLPSHDLGRLLHADRRRVRSRCRMPRSRPRPIPSGRRGVPGAAARGRLHPRLLRHAERSRARAARSRPQHRPGPPRAVRGGGAPRRLRARQPRPHLRHAGRIRGGLAGIASTRR